MTPLIEGLTFGLALAVSMGPIFIALVQTSIEKGKLPGLTVGLGIWVSDILFVSLLYKFIYNIKPTIESESFNYWLGISGALVFLIFGFFLIFQKPKLDYENVKFTRTDYFGFWLKGFLVNTINPATVLIWTSLISTHVIVRESSPVEIWTVLGIVLSVIVISDTAKVYLANFLKNWLTHRHINIISTISGIILLIFGIFLAYRVW